MASTIRHNRARGSHNVDLMSNIVKELHDIGRSDAWIAKHLGMEKDEILRLKQITGLTALFQDVQFGRAWQPVEEDDDFGGFPGARPRLCLKRRSGCAILNEIPARCAPCPSGEKRNSLGKERCA